MKSKSSLVSNYRPISLLPAFSKILEKNIHHRLYDFLTSNNLLIPNQYGFRKSLSTDLAIIQLYDEIVQSLSKKEHSIGIFMDLSKAFETIDHQILLKKLNNYGIRGTALAWFNDYLNNRQQYVSLQSEESSKLTIKCGVPLGSILGPLLLLVYVNDIIQSSPLLTFILFADDTNVFYSHKNLHTLITTLNTELEKVHTWFKCNKLSLNISKTNFMYFKNAHSPDVDCNIQINGLPLARKQSTKFLGVTIDHHLTWSEHIHHISNTVSKNIGILYKLRNLISPKSLVILYNSLILPHMNYCNIVWGNSSKTQINTLLLLQKKALRICTLSNYLAHTTPIFKQLTTLKINDLHTYQSAIFMYKYTNNMLPISFRNFFNYNSSVHSYPTRHSADIHLNNPKTLIAHKSIRHHGPDIWNSLPDSHKSRTSLFSFKATIKKYIIEQYTI